MMTAEAISANQLTDTTLIADRHREHDQSNLSSVSWGAVFAGAATAASLWMLMLILGTGLGLSSMSYWLNSETSAGSISAATIAWLVISTILASGMGGYIAGRFRTRWLGVPRDEVWFRDTAHGFLAWAVSALVTATLLTSMIGAVVSDGIQAGADIVEPALAAQSNAVGEDGVQTRAADTVGQLQSRIAQSDVNERALAEQARETAATAAIWLFIALLSGAFLASVMAIVGGRKRDDITGTTATAGHRS